MQSLAAANANAVSSGVDGKRDKQALVQSFTEKRTLHSKRRTAFNVRVQVDRRTQTKVPIERKTCCA